MSVGDDRQHGGNAGYDDLIDGYYTWDSTVPNHAKISVGDPIALWDKHKLLGISVVEAIETRKLEKLLFRCPNCSRAGIKERRTLEPRYKCHKCAYLFDEPLTETAPVVEYRSRHDAAWTPLEGLLTGPELRALCESPSSQLSMRQLRWADFLARLTAKAGESATKRVLDRSSTWSSADGHVERLVRVRRGQGQFRAHLLKSHGEACAISGSAPSRVLEAAHLYSYAELGVHHEHGGLLLRRDIHRLFDDGWIAVNPKSGRVDVLGTLSRYPQYAQLHERDVSRGIPKGQLEWIALHWAEHRSSLESIG